ncbi:holo-ACP synthase [Candidatus Woesearchaeota archaeon]|nr:holo-ACP synthase [Candidatus Woesearchaeota archaeon]
MQLKTGIDIAYIPRIEKITRNKRVLGRIFSKSELKVMDAEHLAGIFALKEAFFKALGIKPRWLSIEVTNKRSGEPKVTLSEDIKIKSLVSMSCSISHDKDYAAAYAALILK